MQISSLTEVKPACIQLGTKATHRATRRKKLGQLRACGVKTGKIMKLVATPSLFWVRLSLCEVCFETRRGPVSRENGTAFPSIPIQARRHFHSMGDTNMAGMSTYRGHEHPKQTNSGDSLVQHEKFGNVAWKWQLGNRPYTCPMHLTGEGTKTPTRLCIVTREAQCSSYYLAFVLAYPPSSTNWA